jgi:D-mannonate dehydratase
MGFSKTGDTITSYKEAITEKGDKVQVVDKVESVEDVQNELKNWTDQIGYFKGMLDNAQQQVALITEKLNTKEVV